ncbi:hypothetical protein GGTG_13469 [Gaeumannomyces tritici R3-111a-1]|uniref:Chromo domain-containing protein n=1 Tax=Gaeumannomyces tritici (strain R3-111a-1) TaxID=644352 RepID=J3PIY9_GAET3|nr:hypothetical protein GGTG_13469 [Gaeumannomyces tritici R3-111a-1]EJT68963.1 hypothetical protein GGTG_13469 [Gaeumannomyces tritici R3-111a-1]
MHRLRNLSALGSADQVSTVAKWAGTTSAASGHPLLHPYFTPTPLLHPYFTPPHWISRAAIFACAVLVWPRLFQLRHKANRRQGSTPLSAYSTSFGTTSLRTTTSVDARPSRVRVRLQVQGEWLGYDLKDCTWQTVEDLEGAKKVEKYETDRARIAALKSGRERLHKHKS